MGARGTLILLLAATPLAGPVLAEDLAIIVHPERSVRLTQAEVAQIYLKKRRFWADGEAIVPVNRDSGSEARARFDRAVFGEGAGRLEVYWNKQYFHGVLPPATLASDEAVRRFVASETRAIGYIAASQADPSVRIVLAIQDPRVGGAELAPIPPWRLGIRDVLRRLLPGAPPWRVAVASPCRGLLAPPFSRDFTPENPCGTDLAPGRQRETREPGRRPVAEWLRVEWSGQGRGEDP
jgi:hypothetical protein